MRPRLLQCHQVVGAVEELHVGHACTGQVHQHTAARDLQEGQAGRQAQRSRGDVDGRHENAAEKVTFDVGKGCRLNLWGTPRCWP